MIEKFQQSTLLKTAVVVFAMFSLFGPTILQYAHATPIFGSEANISQEAVSPPGSSPTDIVSSGNDLYISWQDSGGNLWLAASHDNGTTFTSFSAVAPPITSISFPKISVSDNNVYLSYIDNGNLQVEISTDKGGSFNGQPAGPNVGSVGIMGAPITISALGADDISTSASGDRLFMTWINSTDKKIEFASLKNSTGTIDISNGISTPGNNLTPKIKSIGSHVYVTWEDINSPPGEIFFSQSSDNGTTFTGPTNLSLSSTSSSNPVLSSSGNNVYVAWQEQMPSGITSNDILFRASTNNGGNFASTINLSNNTGNSVSPNISSSGSDIYVAWTDDLVAGASLTNDVLFRASTNAGSTFSSTVNLSNDPGDATNVQLSAASTEVDVTWLDTTAHTSPGDVFSKSSDNNGATFGGLEKLNTNPVGVPSLVIGSSTKHVAMAWAGANAGGSDVFLAVGIPSILSATFDKTQYALGESPLLTITDSSANNPGIIDTINAKVNSSISDPTGISISFNETGLNTGVFTRQLHFHAGSSNAANATISAGPSEIIQAGYNGQSAIANTVPFKVALDFVGYDKSDIAHVTVNDATANLDPSIPESIAVKVISNANPTGVTMHLTETGPDTGIFGGSLDKLVFMENSALPASGTSTITQKDTTGPSGTVSEKVTSTSDPAGTIIQLTETGNGTGIFQGKLHLGTSTISGSGIKVKAGDILQLSYNNNVAISNYIISQANATDGAILVASGSSSDIVKVTYRGVSTYATVGNTLAFGGSGGGIARAGLVIDVVASLTSGGNNPVPPMFDLTALAQTAGNLPENIRQQVIKHDPTKPILPSFDTSFDYPLIIDGGGYVLGGYQNTISTITEKAGNPVILKLNLPATNLVHLALYANLGGKSREIPDSDTYIIYDKGQSLQKVDPHGLFSSVKFDLDTNGIHNKIQYTITFAKEMPKSDIIFRAWNDRSSSATVKLHDVFEVQGPQVTSSLLPQTQDNPTQPLTVAPATQSVPSTGMIDTIKDWGGFSSHPITDSEFLSHIGLSGKVIPKWVSGTTKYVINNDVTPQDFEDSIKYLASNGIIK